MTSADEGEAERLVWSGDVKCGEDMGYRLSESYI